MNMPLHLLIVEDSEDDELLILRNLQHGGYETQSKRVETAAEMRTALKEDTWDIILSDYSLPQFSALGAIEVLKESGLDIPLIIVSGTIGDTVAVTALKAGANDFLTKQNMARLIPAIERELREVEARRKRREAEEAARLADQRFRSLIENSADAISLTDVDGVVRYGSPAVTRILGYQLDEWVGLNTLDLIHRDDRGILESILPMLIDGRIPSINAEYRMRHKNGSYRWIELNSRNMLADLSIGAIVNNFRDVTERRELMESLRQRTERLEMLHRIDQSILAARSPQEIAGFILEFIQQRFPFSQGRILLFDFEASQLYALATYSQGKTHLPDTRANPLADFPEQFIHTLRTGQHYLVTPDTLAPLPPTTARLLHIDGLRASIWIPFGNHGALTGALHLGADTTTLLNAEQLEIIHEVTSQLAIAIQQSRYQEQIERHAAELEVRVRERTAELQRSRDRIESILNSSSDTIILASFDGVIQQVNPAFTELFAYTIQDIFGKSLLELVAPHDRETLLEIMRDLLHNAHPRMVEVTAQRKDGSTFDGDLALAPIVEANAVRGMVCSLRDMTVRNELARELQAREERYRALVNFAPNPIIITDMTGQIVFTNVRVEESLGYTPDELVDCSVEVLLPGYLHELYKAYRMGYLENPAPRTIGEDMNLTVRHKNGSARAVSIGISPVQADNELLVMAYIVDITAHKQLEDNLRAALTREKELNELKTRFVSMVSHDFRTPLTIIQTSAETLRIYYDRLDEDKKNTHFDRIRSQVRRMVDLLNDVLTINQANAGIEPFNPAPLDINHFCQEIAEGFQNSPITRHTLKYSHQGTPRVILADEKLLYRAITNLLINAFKYSPPTSTVRFELIYGPSQVKLKISDSGIGIPEKDMEHLFKSFHRASNVGVIEGTGLGLFIVKHAIDTHGGTIDVESQVQAGSTFTITIPTDVSQETNP